MIFARASAPWKIFCFLLKFLLKKCYKCRVGSTKSESRGVGWLIEPRSLLGGACTSPHALPTPGAAIGRLSSIDLVLDCMGSIRSIHLYGKRYIRIFFTIEYEGVIVISIRLSRRELARRLGKASTSCAAHGRTKHEPAMIRQDC